MGDRILILATHNRHKAAEMQALFAGLPLAHVLCAADLPEAPEVEEDGTTLEENALKKARETAAALNGLCIADDTGLEVDALGGAPGVYSARYAGEHVSYEDNWRKLVAELEGKGPGERTARFRTVMALVDPTLPGGPVEVVVDGVLEGEILETPRGDGGFGYDPVFYVPDSDRTLAEMDPAEKNQISHRGRAAVAMRKALEEHLGKTL